MATPTVKPQSLQKMVRLVKGDWVQRQFGAQVSEDALPPGYTLVEVKGKGPGCGRFAVPKNACSTMGGDAVTVKQHTMAPRR